MLQFVFFGQLKEPAVHDHDHGHHGPVHDISFRELAALVPLALACLWIGVKPQPLIDVIEPDVAAIAKLYEGRIPIDFRPPAVADATSPMGQEQ
jgi:NADH-quinone oxidoreductase subunit M